MSLYDVFDKVQYEDIDNDEYPTIIYYGLYADNDVLREFLHDESWDYGDVDLKSDNLYVGFIVTVYSQQEYLLQMRVSDGNVFCEDITYGYYNMMHEWIKLILDYGKLRIRVPEEVGV